MELDRISAALEKVSEFDTVRNHRWFHPFPARMPLALAEHLISEISNQDTVVLDPMMGSGTTVVAASRLGRRVIGIDRDPFAILLAKCAARKHDTTRLQEISDRVLERAKLLLRNKEVKFRLARRLFGKEGREFLDYWFPKRSQRQLFALQRAIREEEKEADQDFLWVVFSSLIIAKSAGASRGA